MDALSKILDDIHMRGAEYLYVSGCNDWHFCLDTQGECVFHIVLFGDAVIEMQQSDHQPFVQSRASQSNNLQSHDKQQLIVQSSNASSSQSHIHHMHAGQIIIIPTGEKHHVYAHTNNAKLTAPFDLIPHFNGHRNDSINLGGNTQARSLILSIRCLLDVDMARPLLTALPSLMTINNAMDAGAPPWLQIGLQFLALEAERSRPGRDTLINRLVTMLLIECVRDYIEQLPEGSESWLIALRDPQLAPVLSAIHAQPERAWTVAALASLAHMSRSTFAERFSQTIGETPLAYLAAHRLRLAAWYLRENNQGIGRIAEKVGYSSETAFSQAFKRQHGQSPSHYRKQS